MNGTVTRLVTVCAVVALIDGFDTQSIAFAAPSLSAELDLPVSEMGAIFSAGLAGAILGALATPYMEARLGRRLLILLCLLWFSMGSALSALASSGQVLLFVRLLSGMGLGMAVPLLMGTMTDSIPVSVRAFALAIVTCAIPAGGACAGIAGAVLIPQYGWQSLFWVGSILPLIIAPALLLVPKRIRLMHPETGNVPQKGETIERRVPSLFKDGRTALVLILATNFFSMFLVFSLINWTPLLLVKMGMTTASASVAGGLLNTGAMLSILTVGYLLDRRGVLSVGLTFYGLGAAFLLLLGQSSVGTIGTLLLVFLTGFFACGTQVAVTYTIAHVVASELRVKALSAGIVTSRLGGAAGPVLCGYLIQGGWTPPSLFVVLALLILVIAGGLALSIRQGLKA